MTTTMLLVLGGCRRDHITTENAPFLHGLMQRSLTASIEPPPGFAHHAAMFTGRYPDTANAFSVFGYDPDRSPFRWTRHLGPVNRLYAPRKMLFPLRLGVKQLSGSDPAWIPGPYLAHFATGEVPAPDIFHALREQGRKAREIGRPGAKNDDDVLKQVLGTLAAPEEHALVVARVDALDRAGQHHGPLVPEGHAPPAEQTDADRDAMRAAVRDADAKARAIHAALAAARPGSHFLVVGDHGMAPVMEKVNLLAAIHALDLRPGKDYTVFLNSTLASFWFHTERAEEEIVSFLTDVTYGRLVGRDERQERRIPTDRRYGDIMFAAEPGVLFWPDYFHALENDIKGMHGYLDKDGGQTTEGGAWAAEGHGLFLLDSAVVSAPKDLGVRSLVDVFPTLCQLTGVAQPVTNEGRSLLEDARAIPA